MNPFCVPFATTNMGSAMLAMDLVNHSFKKDAIVRWTLVGLVFEINCCFAY